MADDDVLEHGLAEPMAALVAEIQKRYVFTLSGHRFHLIFFILFTKKVFLGIMQT